MHGCNSRLGSISDAEITKYPPDVELDCALKQLELARNFLVGFSLGQHDGNFALPLRETRRHPRRQSLRGPKRASLLAAECAGGDIEFARHHERQSMLEYARLGRRMDVASRAVANCSEDLGVVLAGRCDNDRDVIEISHHPSQPIEIFHSWHAYVEQNKVKIGQLEYTSQHLVDAVSGRDLNIVVNQRQRSQQTATLLANGRVFIVGGVGSQGSIGTGELYDPASGQFTAVPGSMSRTREFAASALLLSGDVLITGGFDSQIFTPSADLFAPGN